METLRGIMRPEAIGQVFALERRAPPPDLANVIDHHWLVSWDLRGRPPYRSEVLTHPSVHIVFEPHAALVYGVRRERDVRVLADTGWAVGTRLAPGAFGGFTAHPVADLTDTARPLGEVFGEDGETLVRAAAAQEDAGAKLALLHALLRARRPGPDRELELVRAIVQDMRTAPPGTRVDEIAARHHVSTRTMQRLFRRYVGVSPKWVLRRHRLHLALEQLDVADDVDWTGLALDLGYFDHAHFIRDFRAVAGRSPARYAEESRAARRLPSR